MTRIRIDHLQRRALAELRNAPLGAIGAVAALFGGAALAGSGSALAGGALAALAPLSLLADHYGRLLRRVGDLAGDPRLGPDMALDRIALRLAATEHRRARRHPVSDLPTREHLFDALSDAAAPPELLAIIRFVDHDRLASLDQAMADRALRTFADRLAAAAHRDHVVAQVERDCFAILFRGSRDPDAALKEVRSLLYVCRQELDLGERRLAPSVEIGTAARPADGDRAEQLLTRATVTLVPPAVAAGGELLPIRARSASDASADYALEQDLTRAIEEDQLTMRFQPVVDLSAGRICGAEALLRWDHPTLGPVSPARFIPVVERIGLADRYGLWVLNAACREARSWQDQGLGPIRIAVNLSARQLHDPQLRVKIERTLARHDLAANALELELTETAAMADASRTLALFGELREIGISLAIDDFGSGYSSLSYLKNLPFDKLKIDREFVTDIDRRRDSRAIAQALIALGQGFDLKILAEGVERAEEVATLRALGCTLFQGYHFSRPLDGAAFRALATDQDWLAGLTSPPRQQLQALQERLSA